jgi:hypothetical protein
VNRAERRGYARIDGGMAASLTKAGTAFGVAHRFWHMDGIGRGGFSPADDQRMVPIDLQKE